MGPGMFDDLYRGLALLLAFLAALVAFGSYECGKHWGNKTIHVRVETTP